LAEPVLPVNYWPLHFLRQGARGRPGQGGRDRAGQGRAARAAAADK